MKSELFNLDPELELKNKKVIGKDLEKSNDNEETGEKVYANHTPMIFNKKLNKSNLKKLEFISSDTGIIRHFPPAAQEWFNSVYAYNHEYIKGLPAKDKSLMRILKGYFNMFIHHKVLNTKYISNVYKKRSPKKIFVGKGELKHTNSKVIITFYVYNTEKMSLKREFKRLFKSLYSIKKKSIINKRGKKTVVYTNIPLERYITLDANGNITKDIKGNEIITYNRPYTIKEFLALPKYIPTKRGDGLLNTYSTSNTSNTSITYQTTYYEAYCSAIGLILESLTSYLLVLIKYYEYLTKLVKINVLSNNEKLLIFTKKTNSFYAYKYPDYNYYKDLALRSYQDSLYRLRYLLKFNSVKFENPFIVKLTNLVEKLYGKKVEFNIVNLKKLHLNSDILTQAIVLKLKNRKNRYLSVLRSSLNKVKLPNVSRVSEKSIENNNKYFTNKIRNTYVNDMFNLNITKVDSLNELLLTFFPSANKLAIDTGFSPVKRNISLKNYVFRYLKHFKLAGVRLEAKGRLSKRFTASRSLFKLNFKGGLKNVDSSFKGLSTVMLRGDAKSNVQYSMIHSKYRIGAFGIKGWVSSK